MAGQLCEILANVQAATGDYYHELAHHDDERFLREVVTPIYQVVRKVVDFFFWGCPLLLFFLFHVMFILFYKIIYWWSVFVMRRKLKETKMVLLAIQNGEIMMI